MEIHEFWLGGLEAHKRIYRVALGELMDEKERAELKGRPYRQWGTNKTGSVGFMDLSTRHHLVPRHMAEDRDILNYEDVEALTIEDMGIEPGHEWKGYERLLHEMAEEIAARRDLDTIVYEGIYDPGMKDLCTRMGYMLFDDDKAIRRLMPMNPSYQFLRPPPK
jgi:GNAT superfamily N-acetyltransferase